MCLPFRSRTAHAKTHISAQQSTSGQNSRLSQAHEDGRRPSRTRAAPGKGPAQANGQRRTGTSRREVGASAAECFSVASKIAADRAAAGVPQRLSKRGAHDQPLFRRVLFAHGRRGRGVALWLYAAKGAGESGDAEPDPAADARSGANSDVFASV